MASDKIVILSESSFDSEVLNVEGPVLVDFWADWCGPCRMVAPILDKLADEFDGRIKIGKLNVDENRNIAAKYGVRSIPTLIIFKNGEISDQIIGALSEDKLRQRLEAVA